MRTGAKVVCTNDVFEPWAAAFFSALPKKGNTYVVRDCVPGCNALDEPGEVTLRLVGITGRDSNNPPNYEEAGFSAERFRPLDETPAREEAEESELLEIHAPKHL